jgi:hypothetical protein
MRSLTLVAILAAISTFPFQSAPTLADAQARLQAQDPAGAAKLLEDITARDPRNARAWRMLGTARHRAADYDKALEAYRTALTLEPDHPVALYNMGASWARKGDADRALEWLGKARATRKYDMTQIENDADLTTLKTDPRFVALRPVPADFADPFVEPTKIVREWKGEASNDQFGWIARNIGDVDGDKVPDVVTSAPTKAIGGRAAGRVYVYSTRTGAMLWSADGKPGEQLGLGVEGAGDVNRDGIPDVIAAAPGGGYANIYSGRNGRVLLTVKAESAGEAFGRHVSGTGDLNRDGHADFIVGAPATPMPGAAPPAPRPGRAYVYSGMDGKLLLLLNGERPGDGFGSTVAGSTTRDRVMLIVGASAGGPNQRGRAYVYDKLSATPQFVVDADDTGAALAAMFVSAPGDVDRDGVGDVYLSDFANAAKGPSTGRVYVHSGQDGRRLLTLTGETQGEGFGTSPSVAGDVNRDGHADLIVGAWQYAGAAISGGRAYLYSGKDGALLRTFTCRTPGDTFGFDAVTMGDVDRDGTVDLLITSAWSGISGFRSGRMFIVSSGVK